MDLARSSQVQGHCKDPAKCIVYGQTGPCREALVWTPWMTPKYVIAWTMVHFFRIVEHIQYRHTQTSYFLNCPLWSGQLVRHWNSVLEAGVQIPPETIIFQKIFFFFGSTLMSLGDVHAWTQAMSMQARRMWTSEKCLLAKDCRLGDGDMYSLDISVLLWPAYPSHEVVNRPAP